MTKEEAKRKIRERVRFFAVSENALSEIYKIVDDIESETMEYEHTVEIIEAATKETQKWKEEAQRLNVIVEWLREQCLDSRLI